MTPFLKVTVLAMLTAGLLGFMLLRDPEEGFSADPPIKRQT